MGAALATRRVDAASEHWPLVRTYLGLSLSALSECASIFLGRHVDSDDDEEEDGYLPSAYPRYLTREHFEDVFGMLVADAAPHFAFFEHAGNTVCAHHVFCSLALLARADVHAKIHFVLQLYATDAHGQLPTERRRMLLRDGLSTVARVFSLADSIDNDVVSYLEKELVARDDTSLGTCRTLYEFCFTTARISGFLHELQTIVGVLRETDARSSPHHTAAAAAAETSRLKLLNRGATMLQLTHEPLLWSLHASDFPWFWRQDHVTLPDDTLVCDALHTMKSHDSATTIVVVASGACAGFLTLDDLLSLLANVLPDDAVSTPSMGEYMRIQVAKAGQLFAHSTLRTVIANLSSRQSSFQCISADECFFNVILRLAYGTEAVAVLPHKCPHVSNETASAPVLGRISAIDMLEWLLQDFSLLNGKERFVLASFPWFYFTPTTLVIPSDAATRPWLLDAIVAMRTQGTTAVLVTNGTGDHVLSAQSLREVCAADEDREVDSTTTPSPYDVTTPLQVLSTQLPQAFEPVHVVYGDDSLAHAIHTMVKNQCRRVYIKDPVTREIQGVVRATEVLRLLLQEQHRQACECPSHKR